MFYNYVKFAGVFVYTFLEVLLKKDNDAINLLHDRVINLECRF